MDLETYQITFFGYVYHVKTEEAYNDAIHYIGDGSISHDMLENYMDEMNYSWRLTQTPSSFRKKRKIADGVHEVYIGRIGNDVVYIGEGQLGRHKHLNSGRSNCYEANLHHFKGGHIDVEVMEYHSKEYAQQIEKAFIHGFKPKWNKNLTNQTK